MSLPTVTQTWTISPNNRLTPFVSLLATTGAVMFSWIGVGGFLTTTMGYTVKGSCDGTTGAMDGVNRITAANKWATRNNGAAAAQSWIVLTDGAGVDWAWSYNSATDDLIRLAHSTGGNYVAAGTPAQQPTATDECFDTANGSFINGTASLDRVWNMWATSDKKMFRMIVMRNSAFISFYAGEKFLSALVAPATLSLSTGGGTAGVIKSFYNANTLTLEVNVNYSATTASDLARVHAGGADGNAKATIGCELPGGGIVTTTQFAAEKPALQGGVGHLIFPAVLGSLNANADGKLGNKIDHWVAQSNNSTTSPSLGDTYGSLQFFAVAGGIVIPWDGVTPPITV